MVEIVIGKSLTTGNGQTPSAVRVIREGELAQIPFYLPPVTIAASRVQGAVPDDVVQMGGRTVVAATVLGTFSASIQLYVSLDGLTWFTLGDPITTASTGIVANTGVYARYLDYAVTYTSGSPVLTLALYKA